MTVNVASPIAGSAQTGLTSPTYTLTADVAPGSNGKQVAVTALGGTQTGVTSHTVSAPFTLTFTRPVTLKTLQAPNPTTGVVAQVPNNAYKLITRKGVLPLANQSPRVMNITTELDIPVGSDTYDAANVRAALSAHIGYLTQVSAGLGDTLASGVM